jgi:beta-lactamase superfamily II metal-dependent hydrolase
MWNGESGAHKPAPYREVELQAWPWDGLAGEDSTAASHVGKILFEIESVREKISRALETDDRFGITRRLLLDERVRSPASDTSAWMAPESLRLTGWVHLLSSSGIHLLAWVAWVRLVFRSGLLRTVFRHWEGISIRLAGLAAWGGVGWIWMISGLRPGLLRPVASLLLRGLGARLGGQYQFGIPLIGALALDLLVAWMAGALGRDDFGLGRGHYALAVAGGLAGWDATVRLRQRAEHDGRLKRSLAELRSHAAMAVGSWLPIVPLDIMQHGLFSPLTPVLSLISIPLLAGVFYPLLIAGSVFCAGGAESIGVAVLEFSARSIGDFCSILQSGVVGSGLTLVGLRVPAVVGVGVIFLIVRLFCRIRLRWAVTAGLFLRLIFQLLDLDPGVGASRVVQWDVGQGESALVVDPKRDPHWVGLVDAGSERAWSVARWKTSLARQGVTELDSVLLTHLDEDHSGGLLNLTRAVQVACVVSAQAQWESPRGRLLAEQLQARGVSVQALEELSGLPVRLRRQCLPESIQWATLRSGPSLGRQANANMSAYRVLLEAELGASGRSVTLEWISFGDAGVEEERLLTPWVRRIRAGKRPERVIFKLSHHGSRYSTDRELLKEILPDEVWISAGVGNRHGHPAPEAIQEVRAVSSSDIPIRRTDREGWLEAALPRSVLTPGRSRKPVVEEQDIVPAAE